MYKMLVTDLDGTLLDDNKEIPKKNIEAINRLSKDFGIIPVIATARPLEVAKYIADEGGDAFQTYIIATNGAVLKDIQNDEFLINESLQTEQLRTLIETCKENELEYEFMTNQGEVADAKYSYRRVIDPMYDNMGIPFNYQENLEEYIENLIEKNESIPLFAVNGTEEELEQCFGELEKIPGLQISGLCTRTTPGDKDGKIEIIGFHDIMREGVTKASAIERLANQLEIKKEEIIAIGDGGNDMEMLKTAGLKIAMKNASPALKGMADIITPVDNNHGGVGVILEEIHKQLERKQQQIHGNENSTDIDGEEPEI